MNFKLLTDLGERMGANGRAPRGSLEAVLEVIPVEQVAANTRKKLRALTDKLSVADVEQIREDVLDSPAEVANKAGYAITIGERILSEKGAA